MKKTRVLLIITLIVVCGLAFDMRLKTVEYNVKSAEIHGEIKLAIVTDLHSCDYGENQNYLVEKIEAYQPDTVLLGGDIFDDALDDTNACTVVGKLADKYKIYYVSGNHEWWSNRMQYMFNYLSAKGVTVLRGNSDVLEIGEDKIVVSGIDDPEVNTYDKH